MPRAFLRVCLLCTVSTPLLCDMCFPVRFERLHSTDFNSGHDTIGKDMRRLTVDGRFQKIIYEVLNLEWVATSIAFRSLRGSVLQPCEKSRSAPVRSPKMSAQGSSSQIDVFRCCWALNSS